MVKYLACSKVDISNIYEAFTVGFSDYIVNMEISEEMFKTRFFGVEGNQLENSYIAMDGERPVGLILGGLKRYEGILTMRCGALAIHPDYRGIGVSAKLFELHKARAVECGCGQLFLEVIVGNDRAIQFYKKKGYSKVYDLSYFTLNHPASMLGRNVEGHEIKPVPYECFERHVHNWRIPHINWQNDLDYMRLSDTNNYVAAYKDDKVIASLCMNDSGKVSFLYVDVEYRNQGIATDMLLTMIREKQPERVSVSFANNHYLEGFVSKHGFNRNETEQYEMYLHL